MTKSTPHGGDNDPDPGLTRLNALTAEDLRTELAQCLDIDRWVRALASEDAVQWIEPPIVMGPVNDSNRARTGAGIVQQPPYGLDGTGVKAFIYDAGSVTIHTDFQNRMTILPSDTSGPIDHATHVSGTVGGNDTNGPYSGMAPNVTMVSAGFQWGGGDGFLYKMVRLLTGGAVRVAQRREPLAWLRGFLEDPAGAKCAYCAPADGLYLVSVEYPDQPGASAARP